MTPFSSWAADLKVAIGYASPPDSHIAILDTTLIESHVKVYREYLPARVLCHPLGSVSDVYVT
jgi:hypothetical protein